MNSIISVQPVKKSWQALQVLVTFSSFCRSSASVSKGYARPSALFINLKESALRSAKIGQARWMKIKNCEPQNCCSKNGCICWSKRWLCITAVNIHRYHPTYCPISCLSYPREPSQKVLGYRSQYEETGSRRNRFWVVIHRLKLAEG